MKLGGSPLSCSYSCAVGFHPVRYHYPNEGQTVKNLKKRTRAVKENRVLRTADGRFVSDPTHSTGVVFSQVKK